MSTSAPADNTPLQLYPPKIKNRTEPVEGALVGVSLSAYDLVNDGEGAEVQIDPPLVGTWQKGDDVTLWLVDDPEWLSFGTIDDPNEPVCLRIPRNRLQPDSINQLYYTVERNGGNVGTSEPKLTALYNRIRPGLKDRFPDLDGHSELQLLLPDEIKNGVGPDFVSAEICVAYPYCRAYDVISLKCNGKTLNPAPRVNSTQAPPPPNPGSEVPITFCFTITRDFLDDAKRLDKKLHFSYKVTDQLGNGPDTDAPWSPVQTVDEDLDGARLPMPILLERLEDYPGDDASIIDLEKLAGNPLLLVVVTADNRFVAGDDVIATYTAKNTGQPADVVVPVNGKVEEEFGQKKVLYLEVPNDKIFAGSSVTASFDLRRPNGVLVGSSQVANATVTGARPNLKPPSIKEANGSSLDPIAAKDTLTVVVPHYTGMAATDQISVTWTGAPGTPAGGSHTSTPVPVGTVGEKQVPIPNSVVAYNLGKVAGVSYTVYRNGSPIESEEFALNVQDIPDEHAELPTPTIDGAVGNELDVTKLTGTEHLRITKWPLQAMGQRKWLRYDGLDKNGNAISQVIWQGEAHNLDNGLVEVAPIIWLRELKDDSQLTITFKVNLDGVSNANTAVGFPLRKYTVKALVDLKPAITSVRDSKKEVPDNGTTTDTTVTVTGTASVDQEVEVFDGATSKGKARATGGTWTHSVTGLGVGTRTLAAKALYGAGQTSLPRTLKVAAPLYINPNQMHLSGYSVKIPNWSRTGQDSIGNTDSRQPQGGVPGYNYRSSNNTVASVNSQGKVTGNSNGSAIIYVADQLQNEVSYPVRVENTWRLLINETPQSNGQALSWIRSVGGTPIYNVHSSPTSPFRDDVHQVYFPPNRTKDYWVGAPGLNPNQWIWVGIGTSISFWGSVDDRLNGAWCMIPNVV